MAKAVEIISPELWGHLLGEYGRNPDPDTRKTNQQMHDALEAGFGVFAEFREGLEPQGFHAIRKYLSGTNPESNRDVVILVAENLLHPSTDYPARRNQRDRYDMQGDMQEGERTFHPKVAAQLRMRLWRRYQSHQGGPDWYGDVRIKYWGSLASFRQPSNIPSLHIATEAYSSVSKTTTLSFPVNRGSPSETAGHIKDVLDIASPLISAGFRLLPVHIL